MKEKLPIDFITQFISDGWSRVGDFKASIEGIKSSFSATSEATDILNDLIDAYLIAIGRMEALAGTKIDMPEEKELKEALYELAEEDEPEVSEAGLSGQLLDYDVNVEQEGDKINIELEPIDEDEIEEPAPIAKVASDDFYVDFDEPEDAPEMLENIRAWQNRR